MFYVIREAERGELILFNLTLWPVFMVCYRPFSQWMYT